MNLRATTALALVWPWGCVAPPPVDNALHGPADSDRWVSQQIDAPDPAHVDESGEDTDLGPVGPPDTSRPPRPATCLLPGPGGYDVAAPLLTNGIARALDFPVSSWVHGADRLTLPPPGPSLVGMFQRPYGGNDLSELSWFLPPTEGRQLATTARFAAWQQGNGSASSPATFQTSADVDGDGVPEVPALVSFNWQTWIWATAWDLPTNGEVRGLMSPDWRFEVDGWMYVLSMWFADIDGDGFDDLLLVGTGPSLPGDELVIARGPFPRGEVRLGPPWLFHMAFPSIYDSPGLPLVADLDRDGDLDIANRAYADGTGGELHIFMGPLAGTRNPRHPDAVLDSTLPARADGTISFGGPAVVVGDIDGDGYEDLAVTSGTDSRGGREWEGAIYIFKGPFRSGERRLDTDAYARISWGHPFAHTEKVVALGDIDGDNRDDIGVGAWGVRTDLEPPATGTPRPYPLDVAEGGILVFTNPPPGELGPQDADLVIKGHVPGARATIDGLSGVGDIDGDGLGDLAFTTRAYDEPVTWWFVSPCNDYGARVAH